MVSTTRLILMSLFTSIYRTSVSRFNYKSSGVNIEAGNALVERIKLFARDTQRCGTVGPIGGFGGLFDTQLSGYQCPLLVAGADGVGTKLMIAIESEYYDSIGIDLVAMCVNDILAQGAEPLFFLDYFACSSLDIEQATKVISSIVKGCKAANCALIGKFVL